MKKQSISLSLCRKNQLLSLFRSLFDYSVLVHKVQYVAFFGCFVSFVRFSLHSISSRSFPFRFNSVIFLSFPFVSCNFGSIRTDSGGEGIQPCIRHEIEEPSGGRASEDRGAYLPSLDAAVSRRTQQHDIKPDALLRSVRACSVAESGTAQHQDSRTAQRSTEYLTVA